MSATVSIYFNGISENVTNFVKNVTIRRGRSRELDTFTSGSASFNLNNHNRTFDPLFTAGPYFGKIRPRLRVTIVKDEISLFDGFIEDWNFNYDVDGNSIATVACIDGLALLSQTVLSEFVNTQNTPAERIEMVINRDEVNYQGNINLDPGFNVMQADTVASDTNTLSYLQRVTDTDLGRLFVDGAGVLRYRDRTSGILERSRVVFGDVDSDYIQQISLLSQASLWFDASEPDSVRVDAASIGQTIVQDAVLWFDASDPDYVAPVINFAGIEIEFGSEFLFNRVSVTRKDGQPQVTGDSLSQVVYGIRALAKSDLLFISDAEAAQYSDYLTSIYKDPDIRVASHTVLIHGLSVLHRRYMQRLEIGDVVRTVWKPNQVGVAIDRDSIVEGIEHSIGLGTHSIKLQLTPFSRAGFILDDPNRGLLDTSEMTY